MVTVLVLLVLCDRVWQESSEELTKMKGSETRVDIFYKQSYSWLQEGQQAILKHFTFVCLVCFCLLSWSFKNKIKQSSSAAKKFKIKCQSKNAIGIEEVAWSLVHYCHMTVSWQVKPTDTHYGCYY